MFLLYYFILGWIILHVAPFLFRMFLYTGGFIVLYWVISIIFSR